MQDLADWPVTDARRRLLESARRRVVRSARRYAVAVVLLVGGAVVGGPPVLGILLGVIAVALFRPGMAWVRYRRLRSATSALRGRAVARVQGEYHSKTATTEVTVDDESRRLTTVGLFGEPSALDGDVMLVCAHSTPVAVATFDGVRAVFVKRQSRRTVQHER